MGGKDPEDELDELSEKERVQLDLDAIPEEELRQLEEEWRKLFESKEKLSTPYKRKNEEYLLLQQQAFGSDARDVDAESPGNFHGLFLREEAKRRGDQDTLAALDAHEEEERAKAERTRQSPSRRLVDDMVEDPHLEDPDHVRFKRMHSRPFWFPRALRKRPGQERCKKCGRWAFRCKCQGRAAEKIKSRERLKLDEIDEAAAKAESKAIKEGTAVRKRKQKKRVYRPFTEADLPEVGTHDYHALLVGFFAHYNAAEWRDDWTLPDEVWARLEADYEAMR